jgi:nucleotide-binding universal stress UspA family protein
MAAPGLFSRLLVPLDGSRLAEAALPAAEAIAVHFGAQVILIHVLERNAPATVHGDRHLGKAEDADTYLGEVADRLRSGGIQVETHVHDAPEGDLARSVVEHAEEFAPDLVILCAHGRGGIRGLLYGSIAQQVIQRGTRPVLLVQPTPEGGAPPFDPRRVLLPLNGKEENEAAITIAATLANSFKAELDLVFVVPTLKTLSADRAASAVWLPATTRALLEMDQQDAGSYLDGIASPYRTDGVTVKCEVLRGDTVAEVLQYVERSGADLVAVTSHARIGLKGLIAGSVVLRLSGHLRIPLLLIRA